MAIKIKNSTIIDDSRNIVDAGISTITSLSIGSTEVISSSRQLKNIDSLDATTTTSVILNVGVGGTIITTTEDGNVGLGTTNPISKLDVNGTINLNTSGEDILFSAKNPAGRTGNLFIGGGGQNVTAGVNPWNGANNLAIGKNALSEVTTGGANFAFGTNALQNLTSATDNIAIGNNNGFNLTYGSDNILLGNQILLGSTSASKNILIGRECLKSATTGESNVILGYRAGFSNTSGNDNIAFGESALNLNTTGSENISLGFKALFDNVSGSSNISIGGYSGATTNRSRKILIGWGNGSGTFDAPKDADNQLAIGQRTGAGAASYWIVGDENYNIGIGINNPTSKLTVGGDTLISSNLVVSGFSSVTDTRLNSVSEESSIGVGNTINLVYNTGGGNIGIITSPSGPITLNVTGIPTDSSFDNRSITFSVMVNQGSSVAYACSSITLNGVTPTIKWPGGVVPVGATSSYDIFNFTCINPIGSASTTTNYVVLGVLNGNFK